MIYNKWLIYHQKGEIRYLQIEIIIITIVIDHKILNKKQLKKNQIIKRNWKVIKKIISLTIYMYFINMNRIMEN